jgi:hypothetical protein
MEVRDLVRALLEFDAIGARQWVADALRSRIQWHEIAVPTDLNATELAVAAGVVELLAERAGQAAPSWTQEVPPLAHGLFLVKAASSMPRLRILCEQQGPEALRKRRLYAPPDFLTLA